MSNIQPSRFQVLPTAVKNLIIINVLVFIAQLIFGHNLPFNIDDKFALHTWKSPLFQPWQLVTHLFMHDPNNFGHIIFNMFSLWMFGSVLENNFGSKRFLYLYFACGIGAGLLNILMFNHQISGLEKACFNIANALSSGDAMAAWQTIVSSRSQGVIPLQLLELSASNVDYIVGNINSPGTMSMLQNILSNMQELYAIKINVATIGASGAISGVLAIFIYLFPNTSLYIYFLFPVKAKWLGLLYFGYELVTALMPTQQDNIAHWAHIGGAIVGLLIVIMWKYNQRKKQYYY